MNINLISFIEKFFEVYFSNLFFKNYLEELQELVKLKNHKKTIISSDEFIQHQLEQFCNKNNNKISKYLSKDFSGEEVKLLLIGFQYYIMLHEDGVLNSVLNFNYNTDNPINTFKSLLSVLMKHIAKLLSNPLSQTMVEYKQKENTLISLLTTNYLEQWESVYIFMNDVLYEMLNQNLENAFTTSLKKKWSTNIK